MKERDSRLDAAGLWEALGTEDLPPRDSRASKDWGQSLASEDSDTEV